jgi:hypothetical protein
MPRVLGFFEPKLASTRGRFCLLFGRLLTTLQWVVLKNRGGAHFQVSKDAPALVFAGCTADRYFDVHGNE